MYLSKPSIDTRTGGNVPMRNRSRQGITKPCSSMHAGHRKCGFICAQSCLARVSRNELLLIDSHPHHRMLRRPCRIPAQMLQRLPAKACKMPCSGEANVGRLLTNTTAGRYELAQWSIPTALERCLDREGRQADRPRNEASQNNGSECTLYDNILPCLAVWIQ
jgi:hypothetical protein